jgi:HTH-type transcriptional regulator/antitoxin HigA
MTTVAVAIPPGDILKDELGARGWSQVEFAEILGVSPRLVSEILSAKRAITPATAKAIGAALGTSAQVWLNLESAYQLDKMSRDDTAVSRRARIYQLAPIKEMIRRHWIEQSKDLEALERRVMSFFEMDSLDREPQFQPYAPKASVPMNSAQRAWLFRARALAKTLRVKSKFTDVRLGEAITKLRALTHAPQEARHVSKILPDAGVRFLLLEPLPQTRIDGVCFWLNEHEPVVVVSLRYDRIDWFWQTLMHELVHVKSRHGLKEHTQIDIDILQQADEREKAVNAAAAAILIDRAALDSFVVRVAPLYSKERIRGFAARQAIHPGIVVGQLQHRGPAAGGIPWTHSREMLVPVRQHVAGIALTDGWGHVVTTPQE